MTDASRKAAERKRKREAGLVRLDEWVPKDSKPTIKRIVETCANLPANRVEELRQIAAKMRDEDDGSHLRA